MADDILTRLRDVAWVSSDASDATIADKVVHEAADEIQRLRAENHGLRIRVFTLLKKLEEK